MKHITKKTRLGEDIEIKLESPIYSGVKFGPQLYDDDLVDVIFTGHEIEDDSMTRYVYLISPKKKTKTSIKFGTPVKLQYEIHLEVE